MGIGWERKMRIVASRMGLAGALAIIIVSVRLSEGFVVSQGWSPLRTASGRCAARGAERARAVSSRWLRKPADIGMQMHRVTIEHEGKSTVLEVSERTTILEAALDNGIELPHDCKLGVCLTCPSKIVSGEIDQSEGTLDDSVVQQGFALTCCSYPKSDVVIRSIDEDELVGAQFSDRST